MNGMEFQQVMEHVAQQVVACNKILRAGCSFSP